MITDSRSFTSFVELQAHVEKVYKRIPHALREGLVAVGDEILERNREKHGVYQQAIGPFPAWEPLTQETLERRARREINPEDEPLLESEELADSYAMEVLRDPVAVVIGSALERAEVHERGNAHVPPRPTLGPAAYEHDQEHFELFDEVFARVVLQNRSYRRLRTRNVIYGYNRGAGT